MAKSHHKNHYTVEVHIGLDVFSRDYGPERGCADRAIGRLDAMIINGDALCDEIRLWHGGTCIDKIDYRSQLHPQEGATLPALEDTYTGRKA